jgi:hypothetical protein
VRRVIVRRVVVAIVIVGLAACSSGSSKDAATTTTTSAAAVGCTGHETVPAGADTKTVEDVDGDGKLDTAYMLARDAGAPTFGIVTKAGGGDSIEFDSASGANVRKGLVVNADKRGATEILLDDNRSVGLYAFVDCAIKEVENPQGEHYTFDLGFAGTGVGIGCIDADGDGKRDLVGLNNTDDGDTTVGWTRTIVAVDGTTATNGATDKGSFTHPADDAKIDALRTVTCGSLTLDDAVGID